MIYIYPSALAHYILEIIIITIFVFFIRFIYFHLKLILENEHSLARKTLLDRLENVDQNKLDHRIGIMTTDVSILAFDANGTPDCSLAGNASMSVRKPMTREPFPR